MNDGTLAGLQFDIQIIMKDREISEAMNSDVLRLATACAVLSSVSIIRHCLQKE